MTMLVAWLLFPLLLTALCLGCGLLLAACLGRRLPGLLLAPAGFAVIVVLAGILTARGETASLATPAVVLAALAGVALARPWRGRNVSRWALGAALATFAVYAAPVILSGEPTFAGYIKLDDTATWMAYVDRVMDHGRDISGLEPSTYLRTLEVSFPAGYPLGAFLPLGVGAKLTGTDVAWLVQPYMATMAALLALCLYWLARPLVESRPLRALAAFGAAQAALLYAYGLWGGIKEIAVALLIALLAAAVPPLLREGAGWRDTLPAAVAVAALLGVVGPGGLVWIAPLLGLAGIALWRARGGLALADRAFALIVAAAILALPPILAAGGFSPTQGGLTDEAELGNLVGPLNLFQVVGIWPTGDFRLEPDNMALTAYLIGLALLAAVIGAAIAWRRRSWLALLYLAGAAIGSVAVFAYSSPWVGAKALASASPALLLLALAGAAAFARGIERALGTTVLGLLLAGVLWSNALAYHDVSLAPYDQLRELEQIGEEFAGEGPALMTEYQPYGARHFLRELDAEGASELRVRPVGLVDGTQLERGEWADTDRIALADLLVYRTLVLRRSPAQSRPPSVYSLARAGEYYDVWQRPPAPTEEIVERLPLGEGEEPGAVAPCAEVLRLARLAGPGGTLAAPRRAANASTAGSRLEVPAAGRYGVYLAGSARNEVAVSLDGIEIGSVTHQLNQDGQYLYFGDVVASADPYAVAISQGGQSLAPGSGGPSYPVGPLVLGPERNRDPEVLRAPASRARQLCGQRLDWIEALR